MGAAVKKKATAAAACMPDHVVRSGCNGEQHFRSLSAKVVVCPLACSLDTDQPKEKFKLQ